MIQQKKKEWGAMLEFSLGLNEGGKKEHLDRNIAMTVSPDDNTEEKLNIQRLIFSYLLRVGYFLKIFFNWRCFSFLYTISKLRHTSQLKMSKFLQSISLKSFNIHNNFMVWKIFLRPLWPCAGRILLNSRGHNSHRLHVDDTWPYHPDVSTAQQPLPMQVGWKVTCAYF